MHSNILISYIFTDVKCLNIKVQPIRTPNTGLARLPQCQSGIWKNVGDGDIQVISVTAEAWRFPSATAWCPVGKKVTGGGANCFTPGGSIWLVHSAPAGDNGWVATCDTTKQRNASIIVYALCF
ncbi:TPA: shufflon protein B [Salmonella enterica subsp. enterica serovar Typhimurium]